MCTIATRYANSTIIKRHFNHSNHMKIFRNSLVREFSGMCMNVGAVLLAILISFQIMAWIGRASTGAVVPEAVWALVGFTLIAQLPVVLALSAFIAVLLTLTRSYRDSEMSVWFASGLSLAAWVRPVLSFALPLAALTGFLSLVLSPWAYQQSRDYQRTLKNRDEMALISPGVFIESPGAERVFFVDKTSLTNATVNNVFVQYNQGSKFGVVVAEQGYPETAANGDRFLVLLNGRRYEGTPSALDFQIIDFEKQVLRIDQARLKTEAPATKGMTSLGLLADTTPEHIAELHWRIALPIFAIVLALFAIPLSFVDPRSGKSYNLIIAILVFALYYQLLSVFQVWTAQGKIPLLIGLWPVHAGILFILLVLFSKQLFSFRWLAFAKS